MQGLYFFGDYVFTTLWTLERLPDGGVSVVDRSAELLPDAGSIGAVASFAEGGTGELFIIDYDGEIFQIGTADSVLTNLSTRARLGSVSEVAIAGFVLEGSGELDLLIRGLGPLLSFFNVVDHLTDPTFEVYRNDPVDGSVLLAANDDWEVGNTRRDIRLTEFATGAVPVVDGSLDAAYLGSFGAGNHTQVLRGKDGGEGIGLVEVYRAGIASGAVTAPVLRNISTRAAVESGAGVLTAGFVLEGRGSRQFLIRGIGAGLTDFDVAGVITDPVLDLVPFGAEDPVALNDDWDIAANATAIAEAAARIGAFPLDEGSGDAALLIRLPPGGYTARVTSGDGQPGVALVEIYLVP
jgi:hypothetical protein